MRDYLAPILHLTRHDIFIINNFFFPAKQVGHVHFESSAYYLHIKNNL